MTEQPEVYSDNDLGWVKTAVDMLREGHSERHVHDAVVALGAWDHVADDVITYAKRFLVRGVDANDVTDITDITDTERAAHAAEVEQALLDDLATERELRIQAQDLLAQVHQLTFASDDGSEFEHVPGCEGQPECPRCWADSIRSVIDWPAFIKDNPIFRHTVPVRLPEGYWLYAVECLRENGRGDTADMIERQLPDYRDSATDKDSD